MNDEAEQEAVIAAFAAYYDAMQDRDGARTREFVDRGTIDAYQKYLEHTRTVDRAGLAGLDWMSRTTVVLARHEFDAAALAAMTGEALFVHAVESAWINSGAMRDIEIVTVDIEDDCAGISVAQMPGVPVFFFVKEQGAWKFAFWKGLALVEKGMQRAFAESGIDDPVDFLVMVVESISGRTFDPARLDAPSR